MKPTLEYTTDLTQFEMNECNRPLRDKPALEASMRAHGFMPSCPLHCRPLPNGKKLIVRGHHRFDTARRLGIGVYYVLDTTVCDIFDLEGQGGQAWSPSDFLEARARTGDKDCELALFFKNKHDLPTGAAVALVAGHTATSSETLGQLKRGTFHVGSMKHAHEVVAITDLCREQGISFATSSAFVKAVSMALRVPEFDSARLCHRIKLYSANLHKRGQVDEYLDEIEALYNYGSRGGRLALRFRAQEVGRERARTFGRPQTNKSAA